MAMNPFLKTNESISLDSGNLLIQGLLQIPAHALGVVLFADGNLNGCVSSKNHHVAKKLHQYSIATLLIDLPSEEDSEDLDSFNIDLQAERLIVAAQYLRDVACTSHLPLGLYVENKVTAAAIKVASLETKKLSEYVRVLVSRGGRPDLAQIEELNHVRAPTLFIVGGNDSEVLEQNKHAYESLHCIKQIEIVSRASHLFEEAGALEKVAQLSTQWFLKYLRQ